MTAVAMEERHGRQTKWDQRFLRLARHWAKECSKDPSTQVGAVLVNPDKSEVVLGYNGFPPGVADTQERLNDREQKYARVVHAEANAILNARRDLKNWTLYCWPLLPCSGHGAGHNCAGLVIRAGIKRVVTEDVVLKNPRWRESFIISLEMFAEAGVTVEGIDLW